MIRRFRKSRRGSTVVEFALVALALMTWTFGMMEASRALWYYEAMNEIAIEGARCMAVVATGCANSGSYSQTASQTYIIGVAANRGMTLTTSNLTLSRPTSCAGVSGFSKVTIAYTFDTPIAGLVSGLNGIVMTASSCYYDVR